jgi:hypothetical protein
LNNIICIRESYDRRRYLFKFLIYRILNRTDIGNREIIDFSFFNISELLYKVFTRIIMRRWEEFILKNYNEFYFLFNGTNSFIKLKKDYITDFENTANFIIIDRRRDLRNKQKFEIRKL